MIVTSLQLGFIGLRDVKGDIRQCKALVETAVEISRKRPSNVHTQGCVLNRPSLILIRISRCQDGLE